MAEGTDVVAVNEVLAQIVETKPVVDEALKMLVDLANDLKNYEDDIDADQINLLREQCKQILFSKIIADSLHNIFEETKDKVQKNSANDDDVDLVDHFKNRFQTTSSDETVNDLVVESREYQNFDKLMKTLFPAQNEKRSNAAGDDDGENSDEVNDDIQCTQESLGVKDPFTQKQIVHGVRNRHCNHLYEKGIIFGILAKNKKKRKLMKCPYIGCSNPHSIVEKDLIEITE